MREIGAVQHDAGSTEPVEGAAELFRALSTPVRVAVVAELGSGPRCVRDLSVALAASGRPVSQPLLSQHLKVLRAAGLVGATRRGSEMTYQLLDSHVAHIVNDAIQHSGEEQR